MTYDGPERRDSTLTEADLRALREIFTGGLEDHADHHRWITAQISLEEKKAEFWRGMSAHVAKWGVVSVLTIIGYLVWDGLKHRLMS